MIAKEFEQFLLEQEGTFLTPAENWLCSLIVTMQIMQFSFLAR